MTGEWTFNTPRIFCTFLRRVHFGSGAHQASNRMETGFSPAGNWSRHEDEQSHSPRTEVKTRGIIPPLLHAFSWRGVYLRQDTVYFKQKEVNSTKLTQVIKSWFIFARHPFCHRLGHWLSWPRFLVIFFSPSKQMRGQSFKLDHKGFLPNQFRSSQHSTS